MCLWLLSLLKETRSENHRQDFVWFVSVVNINTREKIWNFSQCIQNKGLGLLSKDCKMNEI